MEKLLFAFGRQQRGVGIADIPVKIPFKIIDFVFRKHLIHLLPDIVTDVLARHIDNILIAPQHRLSAFNMNAPIGVGAEKIRIGRDHFRLIPDPELQAYVVYTPDQISETAFQFFLVDIPIAERTGVIVPVAEPTVVHHEHFNA